MYKNCILLYYDAYDMQYIEDIQILLLNMAFISPSEVENFIFHEWRSHE